MNQEKFGQFIKDIRKKHNLTQKQLADKYNVTYQAVSKWENGKNMPDTSLIKQMSKDFNISLEEMFDGEFKEQKRKRKYLLFGIIIIVISIILILLNTILNQQEDSFEFKTLSSNCENFNISGTIAYNKNKSAIYINNIKYCGGNDTEQYKEIECVLFETNGNTDTRINSYNYDKDGSIKLEEFLEDLTISIDNHIKTCEEYLEDSLYLSINATNEEGKITSYKIPLTLNNCSN
ncbi:MAG: helix-turn-helix transcriptional regulator [bacterium]|nr:helix-turn-helix transcriptional regulator [bacterium]